VGSDRFWSGHGRRRGNCRAVAVLWGVAALAMLAGGCGSSGHGAETDPEKGADAASLNAALSAELTAVDAYTEGLPRLGPRLAPLGRRLRAQDQEYVDALTKAIRGVGGEADAEAIKPGLSPAAGPEAVLRLAYELESALLATYLEVAPRLYTAAPRMLATSLAAGHSRHLVALRQALGADLGEAIPDAFETGETPPPPRALGKRPAGGG
jgi:rubrerythrin